MDCHIRSVISQSLGIAHGDDATFLARMGEALDAFGIDIALPKNATPVRVDRMHEQLFRGDHIIVRDTGSKAPFHHGIYIGKLPEVGDDYYVVDMFGESKEDARVAVRSVSIFLNTSMQPQLAVIKYKSRAFEEFAALIALQCCETRLAWPGLYNLFSHNCENFATWCKTLRSVNDIVFYTIHTITLALPETVIRRRMK